MSINLVVQDGVVKSLSLKYDAEGKPEARWTLQQTAYATDGQAWQLWLPCCASGKAAERLATELEDGMHIVITNGRLCYRKRGTKAGGEQSRLEVLVWAVDRLTTMPQAETLAETDSSGPVDTATLTAASRPQEPKKGKPRYPRWRPEPAQQN
jgi:single-stranded DNA-binding protein